MKRLWLLGILFLLVIPLSSAATVILNESSSPDFTIYASDSCDERPPNDGPRPTCDSTLTDITTDSDMDASDNSRAFIGSGGGEWNFLLVDTVLNISDLDTVGAITNINFSIEVQDNTGDDLKVHLWNFTASSWYTCQTLEMSSFVDRFAYCDIETGISDFVNETFALHFLAQVQTSNTFYIDYTFLELDYNSPPVAPTLNTTNDTLFTTTTPTLQWNNATPNEEGGLLTYHIQVDDNNDFSSIAYEVSGINETVSPTNVTTGELQDGDYYWRVRATSPSGINSSFSEVGNFTTDTPIPVPTIQGISTVEGSQTVKFNHTATDPDSNLDGCFYNVLTSGGSEDVANTTVTCNQNNTQFVVSGFANFTVQFYANDSAGNINKTTQTFETSPAQPAAQGGGGGGETEIIVIQGVNWTMITEQSGNVYQLVMTQLATKQRQVFFENGGEEPIELTLRCEGELCDYLQLSRDNISLPVDLDERTAVTIDVSIPREVNDSVYNGNIIAQDQFGAEQVISITTTVGGLGLFGAAVDKLFSLRDFGGVKIPYALFFFLIWIITGLGAYYLTPLNRLEGTPPLAALVGLVLGFVALMFPAI